MRAAVGADTEWESSASNLDRFVVCAPALFERFSSTGKVPEHALLSATAEKSPGGGGFDGGEGEGGDDATSPGARSPGAPSSSWLGLVPGTGGRQRARSTAFAPNTKTTTTKKDSKRGVVDTRDDTADGDGGVGGGSEGGDHKIVGTSCSIRQGGGTENCGALTFVSPPRRARARSAGVGEWRGGKRSPDKARRRISAGGIAAKTTAGGQGTSASLTPSRRRSS